MSLARASSHGQVPASVLYLPEAQDTAFGTVRPVPGDVAGSVWTAHRQAPVDLRAFVKQLTSAGQSATTDIHWVETLAGLETRYSFRGESVSPFLRAHPAVAGLLEEAKAHVAKQFGPNTEVGLEVVTGSETGGWAQLVAYIVTHLSVEEALARLRALDHEWFLDQLPLVGAAFNFDVECV